MLQYEYYKTQVDGTKLYKVYSNDNYYVEHQGILYSEMVTSDSKESWKETHVKIDKSVIFE